MKSFIRDLLDCIWQIIIAWLAAVVSGINLPKCSDNIFKMGIAAVDPEVGREDEALQDETFTRIEDTNKVMQERKVPNSLLENGTDEIDSIVHIKTDDREIRESDTALNEANPNEVIGEVHNLEVLKTNIHDNESSITESDDELIIGDLFSNLSISNDEQLNNNEEQNETNENLENHVNGVELNSDSSTLEDNNEVNAPQTNDTSNNETTYHSDENRGHTINEDDVAHHNYGEYYDSDSTNVSWLLKLNPDTLFREVLSPQYYCLNFKTAVPLPADSIQTALKQLKKLLPWLGIGLRRKQADMWICLYPEDHIDYQVADDGDIVWNVISNAQAQFTYTDNGSLCSFRFMETNPCANCNTFFTVPPLDAIPAPSAVTIPYGISTSSTVSVSSATDTVKTVSNMIDTNGCINPSAPHSGPSNGVCTLSSVSIEHDRIPSTVLPFSNENSNNLSDASSSLGDGHSDSGSSSRMPLVTLPSDPSEKKTNSSNDNVSHYYRLVFGIPLPLADETAAQLICDNFIKELDCVIQKTFMKDELNLEKNCECDTTATGANGDNICTSVECHRNPHNGISHDSCDSVVPNGEAFDSPVKEIMSEKMDSEEIHQQKSANSRCTAQEKESGDIETSIKQQISAIKFALNTAEISSNRKKKETSQNNNPDAVDRSSPNVERIVETFHTKNFINKCKHERVAYVSAFAMGVNVAATNILEQYGCNKENRSVQIGHNISVHHNFEELTEYEWQDRDNGNENSEEEILKSNCCVPTTVNIVIQPKDGYSNFWEKVQIVNQKSQDMFVVSTDGLPQKIPQGIDCEEMEERFSSTHHPGATLAIASISSLIPKFSRHLEHLESTSLQKFAPLVIFFITNSITLNLQDNHLRFSFYNQGKFVPHETAHYFADEIVSALKKSVLS